MPSISKSINLNFQLASWWPGDYKSRARLKQSSNNSIQPQNKQKNNEQLNKK